MPLPSLRSASLLTLLAVVGCYSPDCGSFDIGDDLLSGLGDGCTWAASGDPVATEGEATLYATMFITTSPAVVARGATVSVVAKVPGGPDGLGVSSEGDLAILDVGDPYGCGGDGGGGAGGGGGAAGGDGAGGDGAGGGSADASQIRVTFRADGEGALLITHGAATSRWAPTILEATSLTLDGPASCTVGESCSVVGEVTDAEGTVLYAEEDFIWSSDGGATRGDFPGIFTFEPEESGTTIVSATVLGLAAEIAISIP